MRHLLLYDDRDGVGCSGVRNRWENWVSSLPSASCELSDGEHS